MVEDLFGDIYSALHVPASRILNGLAAARRNKDFVGQVVDHYSVHLDRADSRIPNTGYMVCVLP